MARRCPSNTDGAQIATAAVMLMQSRAAAAAPDTGPAERRGSIPAGRERSRICTTGRRPFEGAVPAQRYGPSRAQSLQPGGAAEFETVLGFGWTARGLLRWHRNA